MQLLFIESTKNIRCRAFAKKYEEFEREMAKGISDQNQMRIIPSKSKLKPGASPAFQWSHIFPGVIFLWHVLITIDGSNKSSDIFGFPRFPPTSTEISLFICF